MASARCGCLYKGKKYKVGKLSLNETEAYIVAEWSDAQSRDPEFGSRFDHWLDLFLGIPEFNSSITLVNSQLVCLLPVRVLNYV